MFGSVVAKRAEVTARGVITQSAALQVSEATFNSSDSQITLEHENNQFGQISINAGSATVSVKDEDELVMGAVLAGEATFEADGITQSDASCQRARAVGPRGHRGVQCQPHAG